MPEMIDLLGPWPVVSTLASHIGIGDLFQLSRVNSDFRALLHGFPQLEESATTPNDANGNVREGLLVGRHQSPYWKHLKKLTQMHCAEPEHRKGYNFGLCRLCCIPICDGCLVRESFAKNTSAWRTRTRYLCTECWAAGTPHRGRKYTKPPSLFTPYTFLPGDGDFCHCHPNDGWLCSDCRKKQCEDIKTQRLQCHGEGCSNLSGEDRNRRSVCLWCDLPL